MRRSKGLPRTTLSIIAVLIMFHSFAQANGAQFLESHADPQNLQHIFAIFDSASPAGNLLLHSKDGGKTWKTIPQPGPGRQGNITIYGRGHIVGDFFISVGPADRPRLVITYSDGWDIWRAISELRWQKYTAPDPPNYAVEKFIPTNHPDRFYAIVGRRYSQGRSELFRTDTGGTSWQKLNDKLPFSCSEVCRSSLSTDNRVLVVVTNDTEGYISRDGGGSWDSLSQSQLEKELKVLEAAGKRPWPVKGTPDQIAAAFRAMKAKVIEVEKEFERARSGKQSK